MGLNCCISASTGKLASAYAVEFPDCRVNTVHTNCYIPVENTNRNNAIHWTLVDVHVLLVDEVRCCYFRVFKLKNTSNKAYKTTPSLYIASITLLTLLFRIGLLSQIVS